MKQDVDIVIKLKENLLMNKNEFYMQEAYKEALKAYKKNEVPIGCVIVQNDKIIARAHNLRNTKKNSLYHAEVLAINKACKKLKKWILDDCTLYVTMEPCVMCAGAIGWAQIRRVVYGATDDKRGFTRFAPQALHPKCTISTGVMEKECKELVQTFFRNKR